jgi:hypothetical protein
VTTVEAARAGVLRAALVDRELGRVWPIERRVHDKRRFEVAAGRSARDRQLLEGTGDAVATSADVAVWEQAGPRPSLTELLELLTAAPRDGVALAAAGVAAAWAATPVRPADAASRIVEALPDEPAPEPPDETRRGNPRASSVEQVVTADGVRRYRLAAPAPP